VRVECVGKLVIVEARHSPSLVVRDGGTQFPPTTAIINRIIEFQFKDACYREKNYLENPKADFIEYGTL